MSKKNSAHLLIFVICITLTGCALVKPSRQLDEVTPIDWGLSDAFESGVTIYPFDALDDKWGVYAALRMKEHLLDKQGFRRVVYSDSGETSTPFELRGELEYLFYGGSHSPSKVCITVRVIDTTDGDTRFMRIARASSERNAFHVTWLTRIYIPSPYPEELLNNLLEHIAKDISKRTRLPSKKCP